MNKPKPTTVMNLIGLLIAIIVSVIMWSLIIVVLIGLLNWNLILGFLLAIGLLAGAYRLVNPNET